MNDKDKKAFHEWLNTKPWIGDHAKMAWCEEAWEAARKYFSTPVGGFVYKDMYLREEAKSQKLVEAINYALEWSGDTQAWNRLNQALADYKKEADE